MKREMVLVVSNTPENDDLLCQYLVPKCKFRVASWSDISEKPLGVFSQIAIDLPKDRLADPRVQYVLGWGAPLFLIGTLLPHEYMELLEQYPAEHVAHVDNLGVFLDKLKPPK